MPRKGIEIERPSSIRLDRWENPDLAELFTVHDLAALRASNLLDDAPFYAVFTLPLAAPVYCLTFDLPVDGDRYACELVGTPASPTSPRGAPIIYSDPPPDDDFPPLIAWRRRVYAEERTFYLEVRWQAETGIIYQERWPEAMSRVTVDTHRDAAFRLFKAQERRGRPPRSGTYPTRDVFLKDIRHIIKELQHKGVKLTRANVAHFHGETTSERQLYAWGKSFGMTWQEVVQACTAR